MKDDMQTDSGPLLRMESITKTYAGVAANDRISFDVLEGEIHALLGENGAGKTTLMRVLYGMTSPDSGKIWWKGEEVAIASSRVAIQLGIGMVHQHFMLIPELTVVENVVLGLDTGKSPLLHLKQPAAHLQELSARFGLKVDPWARLKDLSTGERQRVEIMKTLYRGAHLLVLDEPTAVLTPGEVAELFHVLRSLRAEGHALVLITHKLNEVIELSDRVTVLRRGHSIATLKTSDSSRENLATLMVGRPVILQVDKRPPDPGEKSSELNRPLFRIVSTTTRFRMCPWACGRVKWWPSPVWPATGSVPWRMLSSDCAGSPQAASLWPGKRSRIAGPESWSRSMSGAFPKTGRLWDWHSPSQSARI